MRRVWCSLLNLEEGLREDCVTVVLEENRLVIALLGHATVECDRAGFDPFGSGLRSVHVKPSQTTDRAGHHVHLVQPHPVLGVAWTNQEIDRDWFSRCVGGLVRLDTRTKFTNGKRRLGQQRVAVVLKESNFVIPFVCDPVGKGQLAVSEAITAGLGAVDI